MIFTTALDAHFRQVLEIVGNRVFYMPSNPTLSADFASERVLALNEMAAKKSARKRESAWMEPLVDLPGDDKRELIKRLVDSLDNEMDPDIEKAWLKECQRRSQAIRKGARTYSITEVLEAARAFRLETVVE